MGSGTATPSITDAGNTPSRPPSAEAPRGAVPGLPGLFPCAAPRLSAFGRLVREELASLWSLLPAPPLLCSRSIAAWVPWDGPVCPRCGAFAAAGAAGPEPRPEIPPVCPECPSPLPFRAARSLFVYEGTVAEGIRLAKYGGATGAAGPLAARMLEALRTRWADLVPPEVRPAVVPVPAHPLKYLFRGTHFAASLGSALAGRAGWPFAPRLLRRIAETRPQAGLPLAARSANVRGAFQPARGARVPPSILLVDDVYTSGATVSECAGALNRAGAEDIVVVTVARAVP